MTIIHDIEAPILTAEDMNRLCFEAFKLPHMGVIIAAEYSQTLRADMAHEQFIEWGWSQAASLGMWRTDDCRVRNISGIPPHYSSILLVNALMPIVCNPIDEVLYL